MALSDQRLDLVTGAETLAARTTDVAQRHFLDEAQVQPTGDGEVHQVGDFLGVAALHYHRIELDPLEAGIARRVDPVEHLLQLTGAGDGVEFGGIQAIQADVQPLDPGARQRCCKLDQLRAIGGHHQFAQAGQGRDALAETDDALAYQRLATGEANLLHPQADEDARDALQLLQTEHLLARQEGHVLGHAVDAAEVATVGHRHAQVVDLAVVGIA